MNLLLTVRLHDGRYHGMGEQEPSPGRLFQALVAGAAIRGGVDQAAQSALEWLEALAPPVVGLPRMWPGQRITAFVPNNDLDSVGGDPNRIADIRAGKEIEPRIFDAKVPFAFAWTSDDGPADVDHARVICQLADRLFQFGRGVDMAWSQGRVLDEGALESFLLSFPGRLFRPTPGLPGVTLACPERGTLASLEVRFLAGRSRFRPEGAGTSARELFSQPPKARFSQVEYGAPPRHRVYEIRNAAGEPSPRGLSRVVALVECVRDAAVERLRRSLPASADIERALVGRKKDGADAGPMSARVRILPLPSIGHEHADRRIRRIAVEVPADCPLRGDDVHWAFSGLEVGNDTGTSSASILTPSTDESMFARYGSGTTARVWRTVTPAVLPDGAKRRRIEPTRFKEEAKPGSERLREQANAFAAIGQALRHAGVRECPSSVRVQREPFEARGARAEAFAPGTRFAKERMWHVEIVFPTPIAGPLLIGDGRFLGLGLMAPVERVEGVFAFEVEAGLLPDPDPVGLAHALRRAVMARVQAALGPRRKDLAPYFTGHDRIGAPARSEVSPHLAFLFDPPRRRLLVLAPHVLEHRPAERSERRHLEELETALVGFRELRAGSAGVLELRPVSIDRESDPLFVPSNNWESVTDYEVTRHAKRVSASEALSIDLRAECRRRALPEPTVTPRSPRGVRGQGLQGRASLVFGVAVLGPIVLGRSRYLGGGLFAGPQALNDRKGIDDGAD